MSRKRNGYIMEVAKDHPHNDCMGYVMQHRLVAEKAMGKHLNPNHVVHHVNGNRGHNMNGNLVVCEDRGYHELLHQRQKAYNATGNPNYLRCWCCGKFDDPKNMYVRKDRRSDAFHRECRQEKKHRNINA